MLGMLCTVLITHLKNDTVVLEEIQKRADFPLSYLWISSLSLLDFISPHHLVWSVNMGNLFAQLTPDHCWIKVWLHCQIEVEQFSFAAAWFTVSFMVAFGLNDHMMISHYFASSVHIVPQSNAIWYAPAALGSPWFDTVWWPSALHSYLSLFLSVQRGPNSKLMCLCSDKVN